MPFNIKKLFNIILLIIFAAICHSANVPKVKFSSKAPVIDGSLRDSCWQTAAKYENFKEYNTRQISQNTSFSIVMDKYNMYIAVSCKQPGIEQLSPPKVEHDGPVWGYDSVEFFLDSAGLTDTYCHIVVTPWKNLYDAYCTQGGILKEVEWNSNIKFATKITKGKWMLEASIPLANLDLPQKNRLLGVNVVRNCNKKSYTMADLKMNYHNPSGFYKMHYPSKVDFDIFRWGVDISDKPQINAKKKYMELDCICTNNTGKFGLIALTANCNSNPSKKSITMAGIAAGKKRSFKIKIPISDFCGVKTVKLQISGNHAAGKKIKIIEKKVKLTYSPIEITINNPCYRDSIYSTQKDKEIRFSVNLNNFTQSKLQIFLHVSLLSNGKTIDAFKKPFIVGKAFTGSFPGKDLPIGKYTIKVEAHKKGKILYSSKKIVTVLPVSDNEWRLDRNNVLLHNGKPILPLGFFSIPTSKYLVVKKEGADFTFSNVLHYFTEKKLEHFLTEARNAKMFVASYPFPRNFKRRSRDGNPMTKAEEETLRQRIRELKKYPQIAAWYLADEPPKKSSVYKKLKRIYEICREEDPYRPCVVTNDSIKELVLYADACDILLPDPYPGFKKGGLAIRDITTVYRFIQTAVKTGKAAWVAPQFFNWENYGRAGHRAPNITELRNMFYQAVTAGAKGFIPWTYRGRILSTELDIGIQYIFREFNMLKPFILANELGEAKSKKSKFFVTSRRYGDITVIIAVNCVAKKRKLKMKLSGKSSQGSMWYILGEKRTIKPSLNVVCDIFEPYDTHIYVSSSACKIFPSLKETKQKISVAVKKLYKPGNLSYKRTGTIVTASNGFPACLNDGLPGGGWAPKKKNSSWIKLSFKKPEKFNTVILYGSAGKINCQIQIMKDGKWKALKAQTTMQNEEYLRFPSTLSGGTILTFPTVCKKELKIIIEDIRIRLDEIEIYNK